MLTTVAPGIYKIANVLTPEECRAYVDWSESLGYEAASLLTLMIYLNGGARGGETRFENAAITPEEGLALIFDHYLVHEGARVEEGREYVLRSDVMYGLPL